MQRGDEIKSRRRLLAMAVPVLAAGVLVVGVMALRPDGGSTVLADADGVAAANAALAIGTATLDWESSPATLGWTMQQASVDGVIYALSTAPGARWEQFPNGNVPEAIYTSTDGVEWTAHPTEGTWVSSIAASNGLLYAVGTAPGAEAGRFGIQIGVSADMGETFTTTAIPFAPPGPGYTDTRVLANGDSVLALVNHTVNNDPWSFVPPELLENGEPVVMEDRIAVFPYEAFDEANEICFSGDAAACEEFIAAEATFSATWEELGLDDDVVFGEQTTRTAFISGGAGDFEEVEYPLPEGWIEKSVNIGDTTVVSLGGGGGSKLYASRDLRSWQPVALEMPAAGWMIDIGQVGDTVVAIGVAPQGDRPMIYRADDVYGSWSEVDISSLLPPAAPEQMLWVNAAAVGPDGVAISLLNEGEASGGNPLMDILGRVIPGSGDNPDEGNWTQTSALLVSRDLAQWSLIAPGDGAGMVEAMMFSPAGDLVATVNKLENGQVERSTLRSDLAP